MNRQPVNRDLLVLSKHDISKEHDIASLNELLYNTENMETFCVANEIIDINRYRIIEKPQLVERFIRMQKMKPFVFISNKN